MIQDKEFTAPNGCILVRTEPPAEKENGVHKPIHRIEDHRPDRGTIASIDETEDCGLVVGMKVLYDHTEATKTGEDLWSVPVKSILAEL